MASRTEYPLSAGEIDALARQMLGAGVRVRRSRKLRGGIINTCLGVQLGDGREVVLKVGPPRSYIPFTYEHDIMRTEVDFYRRAAGVEVPVPEVLATDFSRTVIDADCFVMSMIPGLRLTWARHLLSRAALAAVRRELGQAAARIATIEGTCFGYASPRSGTQAATWREAYGRMVANALDDAARFGVRLPRPDHAIRALVAAGGPALDAVDRPRLVHFDLWDGNVMVDVWGAPPRLRGILDGERAFWGDPYVELASLALYGDIERAPAVLGAWAEAAGVPAVLDARGRVRVLFGQLYLYLTQFIDPVLRGLSPVARFVAQQREGFWLCRVVDRLTRALKGAELS